MMQESEEQLEVIFAKCKINRHEFHKCKTQSELQRNWQFNEHFNIATNARYHRRVITNQILGIHYLLLNGCLQIFQLQFLVEVTLLMKRVRFTCRLDSEPMGSSESPTSDILAPLDVNLLFKISTQMST